jgi:hypothetical protein
MSHSHLRVLLEKKITRKDFLGITAVTIASLFGIVGLLTTLFSRAASPYISEEAEDGSVSGNTNKVIDTTASSGKALEFGKSTPQSLPQSLILGMNCGNNTGFNNTPGTAGNASLADYGAAQFAVMKASGISSVRIDTSAGFFAASGQPAPVPLQGGIDQMIKAAHTAGLEVLLIIDADEVMTQQTYISFVSNLVGYYSQVVNGDVQYYEIFKAYAAVKAASPSAKVLFSGLAVGNGSPNGVQFLSDCYSVMGGNSAGYFDIMNVHVYTIVAASGAGPGTTLPEANSLPSTANYYWQGGLDPNATITQASGGPSVRAQMTANGDAAKPIWITEFGAPTGTLNGYTNTTTYNGLAKEFLTAFEVLEDNNWSFVERLYAYIWNDSDDDFGLNTAAYLPKPITGTFTGLPNGVTNVVEAFASGCTYPPDAGNT